MVKSLRIKKECTKKDCKYYARYRCYVEGIVYNYYLYLCHTHYRQLCGTMKGSIISIKETLDLLTGSKEHITLDMIDLDGREIF